MKLLAVIIIIFSVTIQSAYSQEVAVVVGENYSAYTQAFTGFKSSYTGKVSEYVMGGDINKGKEIAAKIKIQSPKLVFAIGNTAAQLAKINFPDIPIVYCIVINPQQYGIEGGNICGLSMEIEPKDQLEKLRQVLPSVRHIGLVYDPDKSKNFIDKAKISAQQLGVDIVAIEAKSLAEANNAIAALEGKIDVFWIIIDPIVANPTVFKRLLMMSFNNGVALMAPTETFVRDGAFLAIDKDYVTIGRDSGEIANQILQGVFTPQQVGVRQPKSVRLILNSNTAKKIKIDLSQEALLRADKVYGD